LEILGGTQQLCSQLFLATWKTHWFTNYFLENYWRFSKERIPNANVEERKKMKKHWDDFEQSRIPNAKLMAS
jgi:hypothetical protein